MRRYAQRLCENSFESVLLMRLVYAPYDLVNYLAGSLKVRWTPFILATLRGSLPGTVSFVLFGASIEGDFIGETPEIHPWVLGVSALVFAVSLLLSMYLKRLDRSNTTPSTRK